MEDPGEGVRLELVELVIVRQVNNSQVQVVVEGRDLNLTELGAVGEVELLQPVKFSEGVRRQGGEEVPTELQPPQARQTGQLGGGD